MGDKETIFEKTYQHYLEQFRDVSFDSVALKLGVDIVEKCLKIKCYGSTYKVSVEGITDLTDKKAGYDICVILSKYILLCPATTPPNHDWVAFRNFKDSGPLISYFANAVEQAIGAHFSGRLTDLQRASDALGGYPPSLEVEYDLAVQFDALPKVPVVLLYNDADEEFSAACSLLFESRAEKYLDAECLAMIGGQLMRHLKKCAGDSS